MPTAPVEGALSASWFCPGGPLASPTEADISLSLANPNDTAVDARITAHPQAGLGVEQSEREVTIPPHGTTAVRLGEILDRNVPAAGTVDVFGGGVVVNQAIRTPEGVATGPCASKAAERWYTAAGSTAAGTSLYLTLFNPFPGDAIADLSFSSDQGRAVPVDLQGVVIPARTVVVVDIGDKVRRREAVAAEVSVRQGRLVVGRNYRKGTGSSTALASPSVGQQWWFASGVRAEGLISRLQIANPSEEDSEVVVELRLEKGAVEPLTVTVPAKERAEVNLDDRIIPAGVPYGISVRSENQVPIVVERSVESRSGRTDVFGARLTGLRWLAPSPGPRGADNLAVLNASEGEASFRVIALDGRGTPVDGGTAVLPPGGRTAIALDDKIGSRASAVLVLADAAVVVERTVGDPGPGIGALIGVPSV
jgi:hypothetical protein